MKTDVIVVGGGLCGTLAAQHFVEAGKRVVLVEAGPSPRRPLPDAYEPFVRATKKLTAIDQTQWAHSAPPGFNWHRVRALGGRTLLWGGWMMRPTPNYFAWRRSIGAPWQHEMDAWEPWVELAEKRLSVREGAPGKLHQRLSELGLDAMAKREAVLPGGRRMLTAADLELPRITRAAVASFELLPEGVRLHLASGRNVEGRTLVLAASPIETARIVQASRARPSPRIEYADHLLSGVLCIVDRLPTEPHPRGKPDQSAAVPTSDGAPQRFTMEIRGPTPVEHLDPADLQVLGFTPATARKKSFYVVFAMGETDANFPRVVRLDRTRLDGLGRPTPRFLRRRHTVAERALGKAMNETCERIGRQLVGEGAQMVMIYDALEFNSGGHETGTCLHLVDERGALRDAPNVFLADGSVIPAATDGHPSLTLAANALRVANEALRHD